MKNASRVTSGRGNRFALFLLFARFMNDRIARCLPRAEAFGTPRRFSSWLARTDRCAKLRQNGGHDPTDLPGSQRTPFGLPRKQGRKSERAGQIQLEERQGHDPTPAQKLLRCTDVCGKPEQILFQKAEEMLFREAQTVACWHLLQGHQRIQSEEPTQPRITLGTPCRGPLDPDHREHQLAILLKMDLVKAAHPRFAALLVGGLPRLRWIKLRLRARPLQQGAILRRATKLEAAPRFAVEFAIAFQADQHAVAQGLAGPQHLRSAIPAISDHDDLPTSKERLEPPKLFNGHSHRRLLTADALEIQRGTPAARLFG